MIEQVVLHIFLIMIRLNMVINELGMLLVINELGMFLVTNELGMLLVMIELVMFLIPMWLFELLMCAVMELRAITFPMQSLLRALNKLWTRLLVRVISKTCWKGLVHSIVLILLVNLSWLLWTIFLTIYIFTSISIALQWMSGALKTHRYAGNRQIR